jgi:hypothetical protein
MEARQNLGSDIALECCSGIGVMIENADAHPDSIGVEMMVRNTKLPGKPSQSLGIQPLMAPAEQTLSFKIPPPTKMQSFDELTIRMKWWRGDKSPNIAIQGFVLTPRS